MKTIKSENVTTNDWIGKPFKSEFYYMDFPYLDIDFNKKTKAQK